MAAEPAVESVPRRIPAALRPLVAIRAPFLLASLLPVALGLAGAYQAGVAIDGALAAWSLLAAALLHAGINVLNDVVDARNGTDAINVDRIPPFTGGSRMIQDGVYTERELARLSAILFGLAILIGLWLVVESGPVLLLLGAVGLLLGWSYSAEPLALNRRGLGEVAVLAGFALLPAAAWSVQTGAFELRALALGLPGGLLIAALLYINQFPDVAADAAVGKRHWVVRLGTAKARWGYLVPVAAAWAIAGLVLHWLALGLAGALPLLPAGLSIAAFTVLARDHDRPSALKPAIVCTLLAALAHIALLAAVLAWSAPAD
ncbi:prenyltransferase [Wenzhouxiangella sp. XN79A]|uniref:prenyltransferase n=1 Tax=Wenzhouxiangella sp. XN79A TaxID=2724193 RepID=UPI00144AE4E1|nr:prenyltransferase [Wenzhouxiangella sp. XN79A]NKI34882.1 prenyltransferase [Wenzhouxiangella sp. XN79A]